MIPFDPFSDEEENFPIADSVDQEILMYRDAHFAGKFETMLNYYQKGGKGVNPDFSIEKIDRLATLEQNLKQNLAPLLLSGADAEKVAEARNAYKQLSDLYENKKNRSPYPRLIADLILSEAEYPEEEMTAIVAAGSKIVPFLIDLLRSESFYDPLFPGFGQAPALAAQCLGKIGDKGAIYALFEALGQGDFYEEEMILHALKQIGEPAKAFLLTVVQGYPLTRDNDTAALALVSFKDDPEVSRTCLRMLQNITVITSPTLATYLVLACQGLKAAEERAQFLSLAKENSTPTLLKKDIQTIAQSW